VAAALNKLFFCLYTEWLWRNFPQSLMFNAAGKAGPHAYIVADFIIEIISDFRQPC
jgi:hypothetical protein